MKKILVLLFTVFAFNCYGQIERFKNIDVSGTLKLGGNYATAIQKDTALLDSTKLPTSKAVKEFVEGRVSAGATGTASNGVKKVGDDFQIAGRLATVADFASFNEGTTIVDVADSIRGGRFVLYTGGNPVDNGLIFEDALSRKWRRVTDVDYVDIRWFGAQASLFGFDNSAVFAAAETSARANFTYPRIKFPDTGTDLFWTFDDSIKISKKIELFGDSKTDSKIMFTNGGGFYFDTLATGFYMHDLYVRGVVGGIGTWHDNYNGITIKCRGEFFRVTVEQFEGSGFYAHNDLTNSLRGNSNFTIFRECEANQNYLHGFSFSGGDANAMLLDHCSIVGNGASGVYTTDFLGNHIAFCHFASNGSPELSWQRGLVSFGGTVYASIKDNNTGNSPPDTDYWQDIGNTWIGFPAVIPWHTDSVYYATAAWILEGANQYGTFIGNYAENDQAKSFIDQRVVDINSNAEYRVEPARWRADNFQLFSGNPVKSLVAFHAPDLFAGDLQGIVPPRSGYNTLYMGGATKKSNIEFWDNFTQKGSIFTNDSTVNHYTLSGIKYKIFTDGNLTTPKVSVTSTGMGINKHSNDSTLDVLGSLFVSDNIRVDGNVNAGSVNAGYLNITSGSTNGLRFGGTIRMYDDGSKIRMSPSGGIYQQFTPGFNAYLFLFDGSGNNTLQSYVNGSTNAIIQSNLPLQIQPSGQTSFGGNVDVTGIVYATAGAKEPTACINMTTESGEYTIENAGKYLFQSSSGGNVINFPSPGNYIGRSITIINGSGTDLTYGGSYIPVNALNTSDAKCPNGYAKRYVPLYNSVLDGYFWYRESRDDGTVD